MNGKDRVEQLKTMQKEQRDRVLLYNKLISKEYMSIFFNEEEDEQPDESRAAENAE